MRLICKLALLLALVFGASPATCGEWGPIPTPKEQPFVFAGFKHDDGGRLILMCNKESRLITISFVDPRAEWKTGESIKVMLRSDVPIAGVSGDPSFLGSVCLGPWPRCRCAGICAYLKEETSKLSGFG
jgi:hypothetical protein